MSISAKLALEFNAILISHITMLILLVFFHAYLYFNARKTPLLISYLSVILTISLWIIAKILKTVSPTIELRWFFIIIQYLAIDSLGICIIIFAYIHSRDRVPSKKWIFIISIPPTVSFLILLTNPLHMRFYSHFDIYKDRFGILFYFVQSVHYLYLMVGLIMLAKGFTRQPVFQGKKSLGHIFSLFILLPISANVYYILFKMNLLPWIFPFPVFDFSPLAAGLALMLFIFPTLKFRYFDMSPISYSNLYQMLPHGIIILNRKHFLINGNESFYKMFQTKRHSLSIESFLSNYTCWNPDSLPTLNHFIFHSSQLSITCSLANNKQVRISKYTIHQGLTMLVFQDISLLVQYQQLLLSQNQQLEDANHQLDQMAYNSKQLLLARSKSKIAQNIHDILGHSLTVVIGTADLASTEPADSAYIKLQQIEALLIESLNDLKNTFHSKCLKAKQTSLIKAIHSLKNPNMMIDLSVNGSIYELNEKQTEAVYRLAQEAITNSIRHGNASHIYLIMCYHNSYFEFYAIDNGVGCTKISKSFGLSGMEKRIFELQGMISFHSDGESGFTIHIMFPRIASTIPMID